MQVRPRAPHTACVAAAQMLAGIELSKAGDDPEMNPNSGIDAQAQRNLQPLMANVFHCNAENIGDRLCGPAQYIEAVQSTNFPLSDGMISASNYIIGGGQIFSQLEGVAHQIEHVAPRAKKIVWGVGLPIKGRKNQAVRKVGALFDLFGTRNYEWRDEIDFTPCASCLSVLFDELPPPSHDVVVYIHRKKPAPTNVPDSIPVMRNDVLDPRRVLNFISSGETVVTSSYHGVYWAQLLGKRVVCIPYNEKFESFQYEPTMATPESWLDSISDARKTPPLLDEYRAINLAFMQRARNIFGA